MKFEHLSSNSNYTMGHTQPEDELTIAHSMPISHLSYSIIIQLTGRNLTKVDK